MKAAIFIGIIIGAFCTGILFRGCSLFTEIFLVAAVFGSATLMGRI